MWQLSADPDTFWCAQEVQHYTAQHAVSHFALTATMLAFKSTAPVQMNATDVVLCPVYWPTWKKPAQVAFWEPLSLGIEAAGAAEFDQCSATKVWAVIVMPSLFVIVILIMLASSSINVCKCWPKQCSSWPWILQCWWVAWWLHFDHTLIVHIAMSQEDLVLNHAYACVASSTGEVLLGTWARSKNNFMVPLSKPDPGLSCSLQLLD